MDSKAFKNLSESKLLRECTIVNEKKGSFTLDTKITPSESERIEFKQYSWPFSQDLEFTLLKTICGFLNRSGGTILIGVNDDKIIKGITLKSIDDLKLYFDNQKKKFYPYPEGLIKTVELPIKKYVGEAQERYRWLENTYVVRIEVSQGLLDKLYTFKFKDNIYSSFREDASLVTVDSFEKIHDKIYLKATCPQSKAKAIIYDEPDQKGLQESQNKKQPSEHKLKHNFLAITNIFKDKVDQFKEYLQDNLRQKNVDNFEVEIISEHITIVKSKYKIRNIKDAIDTFVKGNKQVLTFTHKYLPLQYGFISNQLTLKGIQKSDYDFISLVNQLCFNHKFKENGDLILNTSKNMKIVPQFYSNCKMDKIETLIKFE
ncbi:hypothetical protein ABPG74_014599 [Tetrahymena malaccensis]